VGDTDCTLHKGIVQGNENNTYGPNFQGTFCRCHRPYDAKRERETMVQCVVCEDWYHESCLNLRTRPNERPSTPDPPAGESDDVADIDSDASNDLLPPLLPSSTYDSLICGTCVLGNETLRRWAGTGNIMMVVAEEGAEIAASVEEGGIDPRWKVLNGEDDSTGAVTLEKKDRKRERDDGEVDVYGIEERTLKKPRTENDSAIIGSSEESLVSQAEYCTPCLAPPINSTAQQVLNRLTKQVSQSPATRETAIELIGEGDIFLTEGWRDRWCRCPKVTSS
jgi:E3 ubiquitin-protein ligase UBR7